MGDPTDAEIVDAALTLGTSSLSLLADMPTQTWRTTVIALLRILADLKGAEKAQAETIRRLTTEARDAQNWRMLRDEVHKLDQIARPGPTQMGDDDLLQVVLRVMRTAAKETKGLDQ